MLEILAVSAFIYVRYKVESCMIELLALLYTDCKLLMEKFYIHLIF